MSWYFYEICLDILDIVLAATALALMWLNQLDLYTGAVFFRGVRAVRGDWQVTKHGMHIAV